MIQAILDHTANVQKALRIQNQAGNTPVCRETLKIKKPELQFVFKLHYVI